MNRFAKILTALSLFATSHGFSKECSPPPKESCAPCAPEKCCVLPPKPCLIPAYNAPARIEVCGLDTYATVAFFYGQALEDDLELGTIIPLAMSDSNRSYRKKFDFEYKPGVIVTVGKKFPHDDWEAFVKYTWYHTGDITTSWSSNEKDTVYPFISTDFLKKTWNLKTDFLDVLVARRFYVGKKLFLTPMGGVRGAWIRQKELTQFQAVDRKISVEGRFFNKSISWAVGPEIALMSEWDLYDAFRFFGTAAFDVCYTQYNLLSNPSAVTHLILQENHLGVVRPHMNLELGGAWGIYLGNNNWYLDLSASYNFQVFWNQNMFLRSTNTVLPGDDLFLHGLTISSRLDF